jgi:hypothetical protein
MNPILWDKAAKITLVTFYLMQEIFIIFSNAIHHGTIGMILIAGGAGLFLTTMVLFPALFAYKLKKYMACTAACFTMLPFVILTDFYSLRGEPLAGVGLMFVVGFPLSVLVIIIFALLEKQEN